MQNDEVIHIRGARTNNLRNISVDIPRNALTVITGVSGSGKSSLAFDTLYAEGQRRYVESLSAYARQFLGRMQKPDVDSIDGIPPSIAIRQRVILRNPRSTVGTSTEIYDYLKLLFARIGRTISPVSGQEVKCHSVPDVVQALRSQPINAKVLLLTPVIAEPKDVQDQLQIWQQQGFSRLYRMHDADDGEILRISSYVHSEDTQLFLLVDRIINDGEQSTYNRFADSVQTAFFEGKGQCVLLIQNSDGNHILPFSTRYEADGITFMEPTEHLFDFNSPLGACPTCGGYGKIEGIDPDLVVPDKTLSVYDGAIACWRGEIMSQWNQQLIYNADKFDFPIHSPYYSLTEQQKQLLWTGNEYFRGLNDFFRELNSKQYAKIQYRVLLSRYRGKAHCPECFGSRLRKEANYVQVNGQSITSLCQMSIKRLAEWFEHISLSETEQLTAHQLLFEIRSRLQFINDVGLGYLTLDRQSATLSGGESQRITLAKSLGSSLVGSLYVLDEPSIGLHPRDTECLINVIKQLRDLGNTIVVVEHDEMIQRAADYIIEIGPHAGTDGGQICYAGKPKPLPSYVPETYVRRKWNNYITLHGVTENNLKNLTVRFPLNVLTVVTGVSGSGKSSLVTKVLFPALKRHFGEVTESKGDYSSLTGSLALIGNVEYVDQNPLTRSTRSNPVTYIKAYDEIRKLFAEQQLAKQLHFTSAHFSFNTPGGRCEECQGEGTITIPMQFMADITMVCENCHGKRFKQDILDVLYRGKSIYDILNMTVDEAIAFFKEDSNAAKIVDHLQPLQDVGIGYIKLGQSSSTLSGGESQRVKLAYYFGQPNSAPTLFIFDEPTTGLSQSDVMTLMKALNALIANGHTVIVIEHNPAVILQADHVIDLGPEGGDEGGEIVAEGTPETIMACPSSYTGQAILNYSRQ